WTVGWTVTNGGGIAANGPWTDRVWLSTDAVLDGGDVFLGDSIYAASLGAGANTIRSLAVQLPTTPFRPDGTYYVIVQTDLSNQVAESNEANNAKASTGSTLSNPPRVESVAVNNGAVQRSRVNALTVNFSEAVTLSATIEQAFTLTRTTGPGSPATV